MPLYVDDFNRADTAAGSGLGVIPGTAVPWETVSGTWRILSNRASSSTAASSNPISAITVGSGNADITLSVSSGGGDAIYGRIVSPTSWLRAKVRTYLSGGSGFTEYRWRYTYTGGDTGTPSHTEFQYSSWSSSTANPGANPQFGHAHNDQHVMTLTNSSLESRYIETSSPSTFYQVLLERSVSGSLSPLGTVNVGAPSLLRLRMADSSVQVFVGGSGTASITVTEAAGQTTGRHGIGRGSSDQTVTALDSFSLDTLGPLTPYVPAVML